MGQISKNYHFPECNAIRGWEGGGGLQIPIVVGGVQRGRKGMRHVNMMPNPRENDKRNSSASYQRNAPVSLVKCTTNSLFCRGFC